ncbi:hypothetical protein [Providencia rettgeri]|uniref:hypothetical protein n=1 Tax=Providencia rettgeri TaxID=587 RepID=UPI0008081004|nr:hypothetical protein PR729_14155 [Providencia rettgeri]OBY37758.1 hypothetical protein PR729_02910 [Providencia rettgeri]
MSKPTGKLIRMTPASIGAVPVGRKVNNKPLSADISLSAGDVGAYGKTESDNRYQPKGNYAPTGNYAAKGDSYTKTESDGRYQPKGSYQTTGNYALKGDSYTKAESYNKTEVDNKINTGFGHNQKWKDVSANRKSGVTYTNSTGYAIAIAVMQIENSQNPGVTFYVDGLELYSVVRSSGAAIQGGMCIVPRGSTYKFVTTVNARARVMEMVQ